MIQPSRVIEVQNGQFILSKFREGVAEHNTGFLFYLSNSDKTQSIWMSREELFELGDEIFIFLGMTKE